MRERLIELMYEGDLKSGTVCDDYDLEFIADYLLDNGVIVLPCKVGDTIYWIDESYLGKYTIRKTEFSYFWLEHEFFLTKEEAEAKLAELKGTEE